MSENMSQRFAEALQQTERTGDVEPVSQLFAEDASLSSPERDVHKQGRQGIREFWQSYLDSFDTVRSEFRTLREADGLCVLEWDSEVSWKQGNQTSYRGATVLEVQNDQVQRFATYYDTAALEQLKRSA